MPPRGNRARSRSSSGSSNGHRGGKGKEKTCAKARAVDCGDVASPQASPALLEFLQRMTEANPFIEVIDAPRRAEIQELIRGVMQDPGHVEIFQEMIAGAGNVRAGITAASPFHARAAFFRALLTVRHIRMVVQAAVAGRPTPNINGLHQADMATADEMKQSPEGLKGFLASMAPSPLTVLVVGRRGLMATQQAVRVEPAVPAVAAWAPAVPAVVPVAVPIAAPAGGGPAVGRVTCQYCGKVNHSAAACNVRKRDEAQAARGPQARAQPLAPPRTAAIPGDAQQTAAMLALLKELMEKK